jgi:transposase
MGRPSKYPEEFRREAVAMALATDDSWASVARRLGVNETTLRNWIHDHQAAEARAADPLSVCPSEFEELRRLRLEVKELKMEKEILREAGDPPISRGRRSGLPLPVRRRVPTRLRRQAALPGPRGLTVRVLCQPDAPRIRKDKSGRGPDRDHHRDLHPVTLHLRRAPGE